MAKTQVVMTKISTGKKRDKGEPICMYTFVYNGKSETRHMTESQARAHKESREG